MNKISSRKMYPKRENTFKDLVTHSIRYFAIFFKLILDVFLRRNMGNKYFSLSKALMVAGFLAIFPFPQLSPLLVIYRFVSGYTAFAPVSEKYITWFIFLSIYIGFAIYRKIEQKPLSKLTVDDDIHSEGEMTLYTPIVIGIYKFRHKFFGFKLTEKEFMDHLPSNKKFETIYEPLVFFLPGLILWYGFKQPLGALLIWCSIFHGIGSYLDYYISLEKQIEKVNHIKEKTESSKDLVEQFKNSEYLTSSPSFKPFEASSKSKKDSPDDDTVEAN